MEFGQTTRRCRKCDLQQLPGSVHILHLAPVELPGSGSAPVGPQSPCSSTRRFGPALAIAHREGEKKMLWTICVILLILWALGMATSYTAGGLIHILLVIGLVVLVIRLLQGRRVV